MEKNAFFEPDKRSCTKIFEWERFLEWKSIVDPREVTWGRKTAAKNFRLKLISLIVYS